MLFKQILLKETHSNFRKKLNNFFFYNWQIYDGVSEETSIVIKKSSDYCYDKLCLQQQIILYAHNIICDSREKGETLKWLSSSS